MLNNLLDVLFPPYCQICKNKINQDNFPLCQDCLDKIKVILEPVCQICGQSGFQAICSCCQKERPFFNQARSAGIYEGVLKEAIHIFKYHQQHSICRPLTDFLLKFLKNNFMWREIDLVVPVPLTPVRLRERGFNQSEILARPIANSLNIKLSLNNLRRKNSSSTQTKDSKERRKENVAEVFYLRDTEFFQDKKVLLVDDVFTTGSTANACAKALKEAGTKEIIVLTLARTC